MFSITKFYELGHLYNYIELHNIIMRVTELDEIEINDEALDKYRSMLKEMDGIELTLEDNDDNNISDFYYLDGDNVEIEVLNDSCEGQGITEYLIYTFYFRYIVPVERGRAGEFLIINKAKDRYELRLYTFE